MQLIDFRHQRCWIRLLPNNEDKKDSKIRCDVCNKHAIRLGVKPQSLPLLANDDGTSLRSLKENTRLINEHTKPGGVHDKIVTRLMEESVLDEEDLTNILQHKETAKYQITNR